MSSITADASSASRPASPPTVATAAAAEAAATAAAAAEAVAAVADDAAPTFAKPACARSHVIRIDTLASTTFGGRGLEVLGEAKLDGTDAKESSALRA